MQKYNKNIRRNILGVVSKRLLPKNQSLYFTRTGCQQCIRQRPCNPHPQPQAQSQPHPQPQPMQQIKQQPETPTLKQKPLRLGIYSNLYEVVIQWENKRQKQKQVEVEEHTDHIKVVEQNSLQKQLVLINQSKPADEATVGYIAQWLNYALDATKPSSTALPYEQHPTLHQLKQKIKQVLSQRELELTPKKSHPEDSMMYQSQMGSTYVFKKSIKIPQIELNQSFPHELSGIHKNESTELRQVLDGQLSNQKSGKNSGCSSFKLLKSSSTISSEKNIVKMGDTCYDQVTRMLVMQACTIENML